MSKSPSPITSKAEIRKRVLAQRDALPLEERRALSERITARLLALEAYRTARCVMAYMSFGAEFDTSRIVADVLARGRRLVLPRIDGAIRAIRIHEVGDLQRDLAAGVWGIREPRVDLCPEVPASQAEFVLVPGVAFTARCERLGYGGGYYDGFIRGLGARRPALVAAAFPLQVLPELPLSDRDQQVDLVVTDRAEYRRGDP
jgi:5-formyltetrahydrofolate cyclo-ligase